jgi:hypothetical protein
MEVLSMTLLMLISIGKCLAVVEMMELGRLECAFTSMIRVYARRACAVAGRGV